MTVDNVVAVNREEVELELHRILDRVEDDQEILPAERAALELIVQRLENVALVDLAAAQRLLPYVRHRWQLLQQCTDYIENNIRAVRARYNELVGL
ncbi:hypothetical protein PFISCL1PPCAC_8478 [Pristionchus fissidentatus]|uniref:Biogenesis of lysosome-related organelles complex 1 subunit 7 n=1 Tax=Pristionchus fissidentatus TaxID=1538716 RepID=A0AAV5VEQ5_9BILA|nr:hypothetical protein PFISCL1PPCAC_8478 [Pristionchus fissidentatus]